jgi:hypothetical protein
MPPRTKAIEDGSPPSLPMWVPLSHGRQQIELFFLEVNLLTLIPKKGEEGEEKGRQPVARSIDPFMEK